VNRSPASVPVDRLHTDKPIVSYSKYIHFIPGRYSYIVIIIPGTFVNSYLHDHIFILYFCPWFIILIAGTTPFCFWGGSCSKLVLDMSQIRHFFFKWRICDISSTNLPPGTTPNNNPKTGWFFRLIWAISYLVSYSQHSHFILCPYSYVADFILSPQYFHSYAHNFIPGSPPKEWYWCLLVLVQ